MNYKSFGGTLKNILMTLAFALSAMLFVPAAFAVTPQAPVFQDTNALAPAAFAFNLDFIGCTPFRVEASTAPRLIAAGAGIIYEISSTSGTSSTAYTVAWDTSAVYDANGAQTTTKDYALGLLAGGTAVTNLKAGYALTPRIFTDNGGTGAANTIGGQGRYALTRPKRYTNGLVVSNSDIGMDVSGCYRADSSNDDSPLVR